MMEQLAIKALRPGPSANESSLGHANDDKALANPYPNLPDPLTLNSGRKVTRADSNQSPSDVGPADRPASRTDANSMTAHGSW
jgi:hypothetical protein